MSTGQGGWGQQVATAGRREDVSFSSESIRKPLRVTRSHLGLSRLAAAAVGTDLEVGGLGGGGEAS